MNNDTDSGKNERLLPRPHRAARSRTERARLQRWRVCSATMEYMVPVLTAAEWGERRSLQRRRRRWWGRGEEVAAKRSPTQIARDERGGGGIGGLSRLRRTKEHATHSGGTGWCFLSARNVSLMPHVRAQPLHPVGQKKQKKKHIHTFSVTVEVSGNQKQQKNRK